MDEASKSILTVSGILFGFFFAGFWWALNRELTFKEEQRHFKPATALLLISMAILGVWGIIFPLRKLAQANPSSIHSYHGVVLALIAVYGYMITELSHYRIFQKPTYTRPLEWFFFTLTLLSLVTLGYLWWAP